MMNFNSIDVTEVVNLQYDIKDIENKLGILKQTLKDICPHPAHVASTIIWTKKFGGVDEIQNIVSCAVCNKRLSSVSKKRTIEDK